MHKKLISLEIMDSKDVKYIRMPLGPAAVGYLELNNSNIKINSKDHLLVDAILYSVVNKSKIDLGKNVLNYLQELLNFPTNVLVEASHRENEWQKYKNGQEYYLST